MEHPNEEMPSCASECMVDGECPKSIPYWKLNSTDDLINQFNYVGFHDVCNYHSLDELQYTFEGILEVAEGHG